MLSNRTFGNPQYFLGSPRTTPAILIFPVFGHKFLFETKNALNPHPNLEKRNTNDFVGGEGAGGGNRKLYKMLLFDVLRSNFERENPQMSPFDDSGFSRGWQLENVWPKRQLDYFGKAFKAFRKGDIK